MSSTGNPYFDTTRKKFVKKIKATGKSYHSRSCKHFYVPTNENRCNKMIKQTRARHEKVNRLTKSFTRKFQAAVNIVQIDI